MAEKFDYLEDIEDLLEQLAKNLNAPVALTGTIAAGIQALALAEIAKQFRRYNDLKAKGVC